MIDISASLTVLSLSYFLTFDLYFSRCWYQMVYSTAVLLRCPPPPGPSPQHLWSLVSPTLPSLWLCHWTRYIIRHCLRSTLRCVQGLILELQAIEIYYLWEYGQLLWLLKEEGIYLIIYLTHRQEGEGELRGFKQPPLLASKLYILSALSDLLALLPMRIIAFQTSFLQLCILFVHGSLTSFTVHPFQCFAVGYF